MWVHCPRASNGLLPRRSNLVGYVRWDAQSDQFPPCQTIIPTAFRSQSGLPTTRPLNHETSLAWFAAPLVFGRLINKKGRRHDALRRFVFRPDRQQLAASAHASSFYFAHFARLATHWSAKRRRSWLWSMSCLAAFSLIGAPPNSASSSICLI
jgi:hypothetical protein